MAPEIKHSITDDARKMVANKNDKISEPQKTVAMNAIRALEADPQNVSAILPMLLEKYLEPSVEKLIRDHADSCAMRHPFKTIAGGAGAGGIVGAAILRLVQYLTP